ncbi:hypothetical protein K450DRAFT_219845 [Umbelopsis ramanniana AG]|uniref:Uncharacterized protein n=1 Tax=Umbelopsis ramanniana AG TaxID=1314678 RepID=A0AAD5EID7_UMBRA|nr:uncharacterized protein K450DRAFT_219845 [Umbelopsis ramanniana AG]KAI8584436.1 hypothetical protein K450DRAFT_219845 [Umbelopsis ramanniana AG]
MLIFSGECLSYIDSNLVCDIYALSSILLLPWIADLSIWCKRYSKMYTICFYDINTYISIKGKFTRQLSYSELLHVDCQVILYFMLAYNK